jgi:hypothetical protein
LRNQMGTYYSSIAEFRPSPSLSHLRSSLVCLRFCPRLTSRAGAVAKLSDHSNHRLVWGQNLPWQARAVSRGRGSLHRPCGP